MALIVANKRTKTADKQTIQELEAKLKTERTQCGETTLYFGGMFLLHSGRPDKAREYVDRMLKMAPSSKEVNSCIFLFCSTVAIFHLRVDINLQHYVSIYLC